MLALVEAEMKCDYHLVSWFCSHFSMVSHWFWYLVGVRALFSNLLDSWTVCSFEFVWLYKI